MAKNRIRLHVPQPEARLHSPSSNSGEDPTTGERRRGKKPNKPMCLSTPALYHSEITDSANGFQILSELITNKSTYSTQITKVSLNQEKTPI